MLRPATPLSILLLASFVLLLISVISTPIIRGIPLATYRGYNFGVFGYCQMVKNGPCSGITVGYTTDGLFGSDSGDFNLPANTRHSLSSLLIVHPVAAFCNLIVLGLAIAAHFHTPSHSARYLLALLILLLPTLLVTLLAFLVDILLFVPHVAWGGWTVLASTILITASGVVTCAMRRTLVSRKARKKRIAENAEMSGENFYTRQEQESKMAPIPTMSTESKVPLVNGGPGADNLPSFTTYNANRRQDERQLPNQPMQNTSMTPVSPISDENRYYGSSSRSNSRPPPGENGIPLAPINTQNSEAPYQTSQEGRPPGPYGPNTYGTRGGYGPPRGRGGYPPRGGFNPRGGYGPRGPPPQGYGRGGFSTEMRGGYGGRGRGGYPGAPVATGAVGGPMMSGAAGGRPAPPPSYPPQGGDGSPDRYGSRDGFSGRNPSPYSRGEGTRYEPVSPSRYTVTGEPTTGYATYDQQNRSPIKEGSMHSRGQSPAGMRRSPSPPPPMPPPIGQAVEMGSGNSMANRYDSDVQGMVDLQRNQRSTESPQGQSPQEYIPPRAQWNNSPGNGPAIMHHAATLSNPHVNRPRGNSNASGSYYEDVNPRFAEDVDSVSALPPRITNNPQHQHQPLVQPSYSGQNPSPDGGIPAIPHTASYEDLPVGARSPAESETSHFTSVSQRGVNPNWRPGYGGEFSNLGPKRQQQPRQDMLLANNPDFELAPPQTRFGARGGRGGYRGSPMGVGAPGSLPPPSGMAISGDSPYPGPTTMREI